MKEHLCPHPTCDAAPARASAQACETCGTPLTLNRQYRLLRCIGEGGMGKTYLGQDLRFLGTANELCVLKLLKKAANPQGQGKRLLKEEASRLLDLRHPGIPAYRDFFDVTFQVEASEESRFYMVQQHIEGESLQHHLEHTGPMALQELLPLMLRVLEILAYLHQQRDADTDEPAPLLHLDIKPDNLMLRRKDQAIFLIDFGISTQLAQSDIKTQGAKASIHGFTPGFAPFEQTMGYAAPASDIYAWAMTCLVMLTGRPPGALVDPIERKTTWTTFLSLPSALEAIFQGCLTLEVKDRIQRADELLLQLQVATGQASVNGMEGGVSGSLPSGTIWPSPHAPEPLAPALNSPTVGYEEKSKGTAVFRSKSPSTTPSQATPLIAPPAVEKHDLETSAPQTPAPQLPDNSLLRQEASGDQGFGRWFGVLLLLLAGLGFGAYQSGLFERWQGYHGHSPGAHAPQKAKRQASARTKAPTRRVHKPIQGPDSPTRLLPRARRITPPDAAESSETARSLEAAKPTDAVKPPTIPEVRPTERQAPSASPKIAMHIQPKANRASPTSHRALPSTQPPARPRSAAQTAKEDKWIAIFGERRSYRTRHLLKRFHSFPTKDAAVVIKMLLHRGNARAQMRAVKRLKHFTHISNAFYAQLAKAIKAPKRGPGVSGMRLTILSLYKTFMRRYDIRALEALLTQCEHPAWNVRYFALRHITLFEDKSKRKRLPKGLYPRYRALLVRLLDDKDHGMRASAARRLSFHPLPSKQVLRKLGSLLKDPERTPRNAARKSLASFARTSPLAWKELLGSLRYSKRFSMRWAAQTIAKTATYGRRHGLGTKAAVALKTPLASKDIETVMYAVIAFGKLGSDAATQLPTLLELQRTYQVRFSNENSRKRKRLDSAITKTIDAIQK